jgi:GNAT superfamily N-acetyltransferase
VKVEFTNLSDRDFEKWVLFTEQVYKPGHILTDWPHLKWLLGSTPDGKGGSYATIVAKNESGDIVGTYGAIPARLAVIDKTFSFCWFVSGMVLPEYRNLGIGQNFITLLLEKFEVCGVLSFNPDVKRNYQRAGFQFFGDRTLRRFILVLNDDAYDLVEQIGFDGGKARELVPLSANQSLHRNRGVTTIKMFDEGVADCFQATMQETKVLIVRSAPFLNWRYLQNPRRTYECVATKNGKQWLAYIVSRQERFFPTRVYGTRIIDMAGTMENALHLLQDTISKAQARDDAFVEFLFTGNCYQDVMRELGFVELSGENYGWWPLVSAPIERRENEEYICLGSKKYPLLFDEVEFKDLYFTRGDADRDRATS